MSLVSPMDTPAMFILGVLGAFLYRRWLCRRNEDWFLFLGLATVGLFWLSLLVGTLGDIPVRGPLPVVDSGSLALAVFYPLAYPFWFWLGGQFVFLLFGRRPEEGGVYWLYRIDDRTEEFDPSWES
jgi:hypothetical protein